MSKRKKNKLIEQICSLGSSLTMMATIYLVFKYHQHWQIVLGGIALFLVCLVVAVFFITRLIRKSRIENAMNTQKYDSMTGEQFEEFCANILRGNGYQDVEVTPTSGDHGIDILAKKDGVKYAIQCKRYSKPVGNKAIQEAYSGKTIYNADVAVVMTNSDFTSQAIHDATKLNVLLWGRDKIESLQKTRFSYDSVEEIKKLKGMTNNSDSSSQREVKQETETTDDVDSVSWIRALKNGGKEELICPECGGKLVLRTAKRGANIGSQFYGCSNYPKCKFTRNK